MPSFADARALAEQTLADHLPDRWRHTQAVAREAIWLAALPDVDREPLIAAAVLHDVGYSPSSPVPGSTLSTAPGSSRRVATTGGSRPSSRTTRLPPSRHGCAR